MKKKPIITNEADLNKEVEFKKYEDPELTYDTINRFIQKSL